MKFTVLITLLLLSLSTICYAKESNLIEIGSNDSMTLYAIKGTGIQDNENRIFWTYTVYKKDAMKKMFKSKKLWNATTNRQKWMVDCKNNKSRSLMFVLYDKHGNTIYTEGENSFIDIVPGSFAELVANVVCYDYNNEDIPKISKPF